MVNAMLVIRGSMVETESGMQKEGNGQDGVQRLSHEDLQTGWWSLWRVFSGRLALKLQLRLLRTPGIKTRGVGLLNVSSMAVNARRGDFVVDHDLVDDGLRVMGMLQVRDMVEKADRIR